MRSYCALYVDVGYLLAAAATRVTGTSLRKGIVVSYPDLVARRIKDAEAASVLRLHWYDSGNRAGGTPDSTQEAIGMLPRVKLRLGRTSPQGEQKGVDLRIGLDLAAHGRNRSVDIIYLVSGDDDLSEAVEEARATACRSSSWPCRTVRGARTPCHATSSARPTTSSCWTAPSSTTTCTYAGSN